MDALKANAKQLQKIDLLIMLLPLPLVMFVQPAFLPLLLFLLVPLAVRQVLLGRALPRTPLDAANGLLFVAVLLSLWVTPDWQVSLRKVIGVLYGMLLFYTVADRGRRSTRSLLQATGLFVLLALAMALLALAVHLPVIGSLLLDTPLADINANEGAGIVTWFWPLLLTVGVTAVVSPDAVPQFRPMVARSAGAAALLVALILFGVLASAGARGGLFACVVALVVLLCIWLRRQWMVLAGLAFAGAAAFAALLLRIGRTTGYDNLLGGEAGESVTLVLRIEMWARSLSALQDVPLTGLGMNIGRFALPQMYPLFRTQVDDLGHVHNHWLQAGLDVGLIGLVAHAAAFVVMFVLAVRVWRLTTHVLYRAMAVGFAVSLVAFLAYGILDTIALGARPGFLLWYLFGLMVALHRKAVWRGVDRTRGAHKK